MKNKLRQLLALFCSAGLFVLSLLGVGLAQDDVQERREAPLLDAVAVPGFFFDRAYSYNQSWGDSQRATHSELASVVSVSSIRITDEAWATVDSKTLDKMLQQGMAGSNVLVIGITRTRLGSPQEAEQYLNYFVLSRALDNPGWGTWHEGSPGRVVLGDKSWYKVFGPRAGNPDGLAMNVISGNSIIGIRAHGYASGRSFQDIPMAERVAATYVSRFQAQDIDPRVVITAPKSGQTKGPQPRLKASVSVGAQHPQVDISGVRVLVDGQSWPGELKSQRMAHSNRPQGTLANVKLSWRPSIRLNKGVHTFSIFVPTVGYSASGAAGATRATVTFSVQKERDDSDDDDD